MIYPDFPEAGSTIGICAPSAGIGSKLESFGLSIETLEDAGFGIAATDSVWSGDCPSSPAEVRGDEFNSLFSDSEISMVMSAAGGDYNIEMLPYIDQELVASRPKWFSGYSDPTAIEILMTTVLDIATIYGVNAGAWDWRPLHQFQYNALDIISGRIITQYSYDYYCSQGFNEETGTYEMDEPVEWILLLPQEGELTEVSYSSDEEMTLDEVSEYKENYVLDVTGRLIGGCIDVIDWVIGTPYEDLEGFAERYKEDGLIWFFDNFELDPMKLMYAMIKMKQKHLFDNAVAAVFGRTCFPGEAEDIDYLTQLERVFGDMDIPVIWNADIGHTKPSMTIINGAMGHLVMENGSAVLEMELR